MSHLFVNMDTENNSFDCGWQAQPYVSVASQSLANIKDARFRADNFRWIILDTNIFIILNIKGFSKHTRQLSSLFIILFIILIAIAINIIVIRILLEKLQSSLLLLLVSSS